MSEKTTRRNYIKYAAAGIVVVAGAGAAAYYSTTPASKPSTTTSMVVATTSAVTSAVKGGTLVYGIMNNSVSLDPHICYETTSDGIISQVYDRLLMWDLEELRKGRNVPAPGLSEMPEISQDTLTWTFNLVPGRTFANGKTVTSDDVKFSFERLRQIKASPTSFMFDSIGTIETPDSSTVILHLKSPYAPLLANMASPVPGAIMSKEEVLAHDEKGDIGSKWLDTHSGDAASGPWKIDHWTRGEEVVLLPNENYNGPTPPNLDEIVIKDVWEPTDQRMMLEKGDLDIANDLLREQIDAISANPDVFVVPLKTPWMFWSSLNTKYKPLSDVRVRQAIRYAIDYEGIVKDVCNNDGEVNQGYIPDGYLAYSHDLANAYTTNVEKAKSLMNDAGYSQGFDLKAVTYKETIAAVNWEKLVLKLKDDLGKININVVPTPFPVATWYEKFETGDFQLMLAAWIPDYPDPDELTWLIAQSSSMFMSGTGWTGTDFNKQIDELESKGQTSLDENVRVQAYQGMTKILQEQSPQIGLFQKYQNLAVRREVKGLVWDYTGFFPVFAWLWKEKKTT